MLKFNPSYRTKIYLSDAGYLVIEQEDYAGQEQTVHLSPEQSQSLYNFLEDSIEAQDDRWTSAIEGSDECPVES
jgi:hypothetical protein